MAERSDTHNHFVKAMGFASGSTHPCVLRYTSVTIHSGTFEPGEEPWKNHMNNAPPLSPSDWISWMRDYAAAAERFTQEQPIPVSSEQERELVAIKAALYARALTLFQGSLLLLENDRQLDFRIHSRGVVEATMYLIALDRNAAFVDKMKDDDFKSRHSRAGLHLNSEELGSDPDVRRMLEDFVGQGARGAKPIQLAKLLQGTEFNRLYRTFRDISGDASHVSLTSLSRHYTENLVDQSATLLVHPALDEVDMKLTVTELGISMSIATLLLMKTKKRTELWDSFQDLVRRYRALSNPSTSDITPS